MLDERPQFIAAMLGSSSLQFPRRFQKASVGVDRVIQRLDSDAPMSLGGADRDVPLIWRLLDLPHHPQLRHQLVCALSIRLIDDENISDLHETRLERLNGIPGLGYQQDHGGVSGFDDVEFRLANANG